MIEITIIDSEPANTNSIWIYFVAPIIVAILSYFFVDLWGEWKKRRSFSGLSIAIIESFQEEIRNGVKLMKGTISKLRESELPSALQQSLPTGSWDGMKSIPHEVLLRVIETSRSFVPEAEEFHPRDIRIHCKNYFEIICINFSTLIRELHLLSPDKVTPDRVDIALKNILYLIESGERVYRMLEKSKGLLEINRKKWLMPK